MIKIGTEDPILRRFLSKVDIRGEDECWNWKGSKDTAGYGMFWLQGSAKGAHRISYFIKNGELPGFDAEGNELCIRHSCNNPACCNPAHLLIGTDKDNLIDSVKSGTHVGKVTLYAGEIWLIRKLKVPITNFGKYPKYKFTSRYVAKMFKVCQWTILNIWKQEKYLCKEGYYV